ncbi:MAG: SsrA-binding protein SmpB [Patescibacteria group bacterium]
MSATLIENKKVTLRFSILETFSAGLELSGGEVKALRAKLGSLEGARVVVRAGEAYLVGATIPPYQMANTEKGYDPEKTRRLLLNKKEIAQLADAESKKGLTVVPLELYNAGRYLKARIAIVQGKNKADKREDLKLKDAKREIDRALKQKR